MPPPSISGLRIKGWAGTGTSKVRYGLPLTNGNRRLGGVVGSVGLLFESEISLWLPCGLLGWAAVVVAVVAAVPWELERLLCKEVAAAAGLRKPARPSGELSVTPLLLLALVAVAAAGGTPVLDGAPLLLLPLLLLLLLLLLLEVAVCVVPALYSSVRLRSSQLSAVMLGVAAPWISRRVICTAGVIKR